MQQSIVLIGIGEIGGVLAKGLLRAGFPIIPITREIPADQVADQVPSPRQVVIAVGEKDLPVTLEGLPAVWRDRVVLLQNELLPRDWERHGLSNPTVLSIWFEKKPGIDSKVLLPSPVYGPAASLLVDALGRVEIPARELDSSDELLFELVLKNLYIVTTNIAGLVVGGSVSQLWRDHRELAREIAEEVMDLQAWLTGVPLDRERLLQAMVTAFEADPQHRCMGRSAPARLQRALEQADQAGLVLPRIRQIRESFPTAESA